MELPGNYREGRQQCAGCVCVHLQTHMPLRGDELNQERLSNFLSCIKGEMTHRKVTVGSCTILVTTCCLKESRFLYASIKDFTNMDLILRGVL